MSALATIRPERGEAMDAFLARIGWVGATRRMLAGDASFRRYERVEHQGTIAVLMDAPPPWEDVRPFIAVTHVLTHCGVSVPHIIARDEAEGFLLLEDLGDLSFTRMLREHPEREAELYSTAADALIAIHMNSMAKAEILQDELPPYDMTVYLREASLFVEWFLPQVHGIVRARALKDEYLNIWRTIIESVKLKQNCIVHRDYHADNLFWLGERSDYQAVGMIDYQDALWGDAAYDLASLLEDARRDVDPTVMAECFARYSTAIGEPAREFAARYAVLAAQRNAKIIGIFCRLCVRDGKAHYVDYLPRVWNHFMNDLHHPLLKPLADFIERNVPVNYRGHFEIDMSVGGIAP